MWPRVADTPGTGALPSTPAPGKRHAYPGTGSSQRLPKGLKLRDLVVLHQLGQAAVAAGVPRDEVAPVWELHDDEVSAAVTPPATQARVA